MALPGDVPVEVYTAEEYEEGADYEVDSIVAEKRIGRGTFYLVKWKVCLLHFMCLIVSITPKHKARLSVLSRDVINALKKKIAL